MKINLRDYFNSVKIRNKLIFILFVLFLTVCLIGMLALQVSFNIYDAQIINESTEILNLYSTNIDNELRKIENLTFGILSDTKVQRYLNTIKYGNETYEGYSAVDEFSKMLLLSSQTENYIASASFIDTKEHEYAVGRNVIQLNESRKRDVVKRAMEGSGALVWIEPSGEDKCIIAAREIRSVNNMENLAVLLVRIDLDKLINSHFSMKPMYKSSMFILLGDKMIFSNDNNVDIKDIGIHSKGIHSYRVQSINREKLLINYGASAYTGWTYINLLAYDSIFKGIVAMRTIMVCLYVLVFLLAMVLGLKFSNSITKPIVSLSKEMKRVENGDFSISEMASASLENCDEIGQLRNDFKIMVNKIDTLINENYVRNLMVKEAELKALQAQINPHFLYNTLASINGLAKMNGQDKISAMVKALGNLFRSAINNKEVVILISEELRLLNDYVTIQKIRYGERLEVYIDVDENIRDHKIVKLTLQPLVENSINYGLETQTGICRIDVKGYIDGSCIRIVVSDNGPGISVDLIQKLKSGEIQPRGSGFGLMNINERIKMAFGEQYGISIYSEVNEGTAVNIMIPYEPGCESV